MNFRFVLDGVEKLVDAADIEKAKELAQAWAEDASWDTSEGTIWVAVHIFAPDTSEEDGWYDELELQVTINPPEPDCTESEHDWQAPVEIVGGIEENPGVWGHGGGVVMHEVCLHCGCERITDTWAQNRETGEQGLESVRYDPGKYSDEVEALKSACIEG